MEMFEMIMVMLYVLENKVTTGDVIAIVVAIIALTGVIISTVYTNYTTNKINKSNEKQQSDLQQKNIDANLVANARIEWIQNVRRTTAELISQYFLIINTVDEEILTEALLKTKEKTELLILYFGPDTKKEKNIYNEKDNSGKNENIVNFLMMLANKTDLYYKDAVSDKLIKLENVRKRRLESLSEYVIGWEYEEVELDNGRVYQNPIPKIEETEKESLKELDEQIEKLKNITEDIREDLTILRNIIRIYLKIEWNISKLGK